jgi:flagellar protein FliL
MYATIGDGAGANTEPELGAGLELDSLTLNLADGRFLKLAFALQLTKEASEGGGHGGGGDGPSGAQAVDLAIAQLSNRRIAELNSTKAREKAKADMLRAVAEAYRGDVVDLYFTQFVTQSGYPGRRGQRSASSNAA